MSTIVKLQMQYWTAEGKYVELAFDAKKRSDGTMAMVRSTHTYAVLEISKEAWEEIYDLLAKAEYGQAFHESSEYDRGVIDMHGIALAIEKESEKDVQQTT